MAVFAVVLSGGSSTRMQGINKSFYELNGVPVLVKSIQAFESSPLVSGVIVVSRSDLIPEIRDFVKKYGLKKVVSVVEGGKERQDSVYNGLKACPACDIVCIHNGANPFVSQREIAESIEACERFGASVAGEPCRDTIKEVDSEGFVVKTLERKKLWAMQTPQTIKYGLALDVFAKASKEGFLGTDDVSLVEKYSSEKVKLVLAERENFKITNPFDLMVAEAIVSRERGAKMDSEIFVLAGFGQDSHRISDSGSKQLVLCGAKCPGIFVEARSDGDVAYHSVFNSISSALGRGSIGDFFPDKDEKNEGRNSEDFFAPLLSQMDERGLSVHSLSLSLECSKPKIGPLVPQMKKNLSRIFSLPEERIGITATSGEGLTSFGKGEGVQVFSFSVLRRK